MKNVLTFLSLFFCSFFAFAQNDCQEFLDMINNSKEYDSEKIIKLSNDFYKCIEDEKINLISQMKDLRFISHAYANGVFIAVLNKGISLFNLKSNSFSKRYNIMNGLVENYAAVKSGEFWGFIDANGKEIISCKYHNVKDFSDSLAGVKLNNKWGFINRKGNITIPLKYDYINSFHNGFASVENEGNFGVIDVKGNVVIPFIYDYISSISEDLFVVGLNKKYGYINSSNKKLIPLIYDFANPFSENVAYVGLDKYELFIDKSGNEVLHIDNEDIKLDDYMFSNGLLSVSLKSNKKYGYIKKDGKFSIPALYDYVYRFENEKAKVKIDGLNFYINTKGECVKDCENAPADHPRANN